MFPRMASSVLLGVGLLASPVLSQTTTGWAADSRAPGSLVKAPGPESLRRAGVDDPSAFLSRFARAYKPGRSGQVFFVTKPGYFFTFPRVPFNHGSPWDYDAHVPLVFYGPQQIRTGVHPSEDAQAYDIPATFSALAGVAPSNSSHGRVLRSAMEPKRPPLKALLVVVMDQVGLQDVEKYAQYMPTLSRWRRQGAEYPSVRHNYLPTFTAVSHASIGTGSPPAVHGIVSNMLPDSNGKLKVVFRTKTGPGKAAQVTPETSLVPTLADSLDLAFQNRSKIIGQIYAEYAAVAVSGHGSQVPGGDRDIVLWHGKDGSLTTDTRYYRIPRYMRDRSSQPVSKKKNMRYAGLDLKKAGGVHSAGWYAEWEADSVLEMMDKEGVGLDSVPDLVMINLKTSDAFGHAFGHDHRGYRGTLAQIDRFLRKAELQLNNTAGPGGFAVVVTADHGLVPDDGAMLFHRDYVSWMNGKLDSDGNGQGPILDVFGGHVYVDSEEAKKDRVTLLDIQNLLESDPAILHVWTEDDVRTRQSEIPLHRQSSSR